MKTKNLIKIPALSVLALAVLSLSSCLKDSRYLNLAASSTVVELTQSGPGFFGPDAITATGPKIVIQFAVDIASPVAPSTPTTVVIGVDNSIVATYNAANPGIVYNVFPATAFTFPDQTITIPAGQRTATLTLNVDKTTLDPSLSYMLPITIKNGGGYIISGNFGIHYYHVIGNDFAGPYTWDYRRWQNGTGPGSTNIPPDITGLNQAGTILPVSPTEFEMLTGYNNSGVYYDITFTKTVSGGVTTYSNWTVTFDANSVANGWTPAGITNMVAPTFTVPPPTTNSSPKIFEMHHITGGASARYIDDTYHK